MTALAARPVVRPAASATVPLSEAGGPAGVLAGPAAVTMWATYLAFAPLSHSAVIQPATITLASLALANVMLGEAMTRGKAIGGPVIVAGLVLVAGAGASADGAPLGAGRAALFPALVPVATLLIGMPVTGLMPSTQEWTGGALATLGLGIAFGAIRLPRPSRRSFRSRRRAN